MAQARYLNIDLREFFVAEFAFASGNRESGWGERGFPDNRTECETYDLYRVFPVT